MKTFYQVSRFFVDSHSDVKEDWEERTHMVFFPIPPESEREATMVAKIVNELLLEFWEHVDKTTRKYGFNEEYYYDIPDDNKLSNDVDNLIEADFDENDLIEWGQKNKADIIRLFKVFVVSIIMENLDGYVESSLRSDGEIMGYPRNCEWHPDGSVEEWYWETKNTRIVPPEEG